MEVEMKKIRMVGEWLAGLNLFDKTSIKEEKGRQKCVKYAC
ncbi:22568_t:CDS:2 [Rhizophagus irregularis]|nr:22568_t:CDS:2 [Rhizophagus irregularis]